MGLVVGSGVGFKVDGAGVGTLVGANDGAVCTLEKRSVVTEVPSATLDTLGCDTILKFICCA